jgi:hypothetical protein
MVLNGTGTMQQPRRALFFRLKLMRRPPALMLPLRLSNIGLLMMKTYKVKKRR